MRYAIVLTVVFALMAVFLGNAGAAGMVVKGQEPCDCPSLIARGIIPDPLNRLADMLYFPQVASALDSVAVEVRSMLTPADTEGTAVEPEEEAKETKEKSTLEEKPEAPAKEAVRHAEKKKAVAHAKKPSHKKKKRVKMPTKAM